MTFERKRLRTICGPIFNQEIQTYERISNENIKRLYNIPDILSFIRRKRLEWFGDAWKTDGHLIKNVLDNKTGPDGLTQSLMIY